MRLLFAALCLACLVVPPAAAQALKGDLRPALPRSRAGAPIGVEATLHWPGPGILEGRLEVLVAGDAQALYRWTGPEMALVRGRNAFRLTLPGVPAESVWQGRSVEARAHFIAGKERLALGSFTLPVSSRDSRTLVICVARAPVALDPRHEKLPDLLRLERLRPEPEEGGGQGSGVPAFSTLTAWVPVEELPEEPLGWCAFDLVYLAGEGLARAREKALRGLAAWVRAGGSLCLVPAAGLEARHLDLLRRLAPGRAFQQGSDGGLELDGRPLAAPVLLRAELGRLALLPPGLDPGREGASRAWREVLASLWKLRPAQAQKILESGRWLEVAGQGDEYARQFSRYRQYSSGPYEGGEWRTQVTQAVLDHLKPKEIQAVPFWLIALVYLGFIALIGPVDWIVLGWLRRRVLTWVLLPVVSVAATWLLVVLAEWYMKGAETRRSLVVADVGAGGEVLRTNRFELLLPGTSRDHATRVEAGLFAPVLTGGSFQGRDFPTDPLSGDRPTTYRGRVPGSYEVLQGLRKWTPQLNRTFAIGGAGVRPAGLRWDAVDPAFLAAHRRGLGGADWRGQLGVTGGELFVHRVAELRSGTDLWRQLSGAPAQGLLGLLAGVSPGGGESLEDLTVACSAPDRAWLAMWVTRQGQDVLVYRRLYELGE